MKLWKWEIGSKKERLQREAVEQDRLLLVEEIRKAHMEWEVAQRRFDYVVEKEQIDYAIFALEAAEKRFEMLLKQAKNLNISAKEVCAARSMEVSS
ncbi:DUF2508 family protein [Paenibacillus tyrfis]|uniref:DUF2508 domain-containing protein n=1 Tax=Paenibacillus tyrfis TaxID=1501230 RepID=A0A081NYZ5_9BACL|nr:DUF2508 family protein [Paenibacillus tyrfis]KEQ23668.1 hypothetical protein ET33_16265 [Paenibacillus tyrfis]